MNMYNESSFYAGEMSAKIMQVIADSDEKMARLSLDALMRVFVYIAKSDDRSLEKIESDVLKAIKYYYYNETKK